MTTHLTQGEKHALVTTFMSGAMKRFPYPGEDFFQRNEGVLISHAKPKASQLNGLRQMAMDAESIEEMLREIESKLKKATMEEWRMGVIDTLPGTGRTKRVDLGSFLMNALTDIRDWTEKRFQDRWLREQVDLINAVLRERDYGEISANDARPSEQQKVQLARAFVDRFVTSTLVRRRERGL